MTGMSQTFSLRPRAATAPLTIGHLLELGDLWPIGGDPNDPGFLATPLGSEPLYVYGETPGRGFSVAFDDEYQIRVNTPATSHDWAQALGLARALATELAATITTENGDVLTADTVSSFPWRHDVLFGLEAMAARSQDYAMLTIWGAIRRMDLAAPTWQWVMSERDPVAAFDHLVVGIQSIDAYDANPIVIREDDGSMTAIFVLTEGIPTVLPLTPELPKDAYEGITEADRWDVILLADDAERTQLGRVGWTEFTGRVPAHCARRLDDGQVLVEVDREAQSGILG